jgi:hypothetical protein
MMCIILGYDDYNTVNETIQGMIENIFPPFKALPVKENYVDSF